MFRPYTLLCTVHRQLTHVLGEASKVQAVSFKSHVSIDKLYPNSNQDYLVREKTDHVKTNSSAEQSRDKETFSGYIPMEQLEISASRSSGPGGQHVNKVNSKVEMRFHLDSATWIPEWIKPRLAEQEHGKITKDGYLVVRSDMTRKQMLNQADCVTKLRNMIFAASVLPKEPTKEEIKIKEERIAKAKAGILREKKKKSLLKKSRNDPGL